MLKTVDSNPVVKLNRRKKFRRYIFSLIIFAMGFILYAVVIEPQMLRVTHQDVYIRNLPQEFDGFTIAQATDLHVAIWVKPAHIRGMVDKMINLHSDMIVLTGDYVSMSAKYAQPAADELSRLDAPYGIYAVLGNHDYWTDSERVASALKSADIDVMFNENREIRKGASGIRLLGFDDTWEGDTDYGKAFVGVPYGEILIGIAHNPDTVLSIEDKHVSLLLTGHTHGGLINLPFKGPLFAVTKLGSKYSAGMFDFGDTKLYVSRGVGLGTMSHVRFNCPPEITFFTLRRID
ncbi:MAG: metallophosphoesterase [Armatimonadota bacterium]